MQNDKNILSRFSLRDNKFTFKGKALCIKDSMFLCYYYLQGAQKENIKDVILKAMQQVKESKSYFDRVLWLWTLGEYINKAKAGDSLDTEKAIIMDIVEEIENNWAKPMKSWINTDQQEDVYLTNLALDYGALLSINNELKSEAIMQLMKKIKEFMFKNLMRGSRVASKLTDNIIMGDIGLVAVPFALVDAGNQILVASISEVEKQLLSKGVRLSSNDTYFGGCVRNTLTVMLAWYYSEKGQVDKAKGLLGHIKNAFEKAGELGELALETSKVEALYKYWAEKDNTILGESPFVYILFAIAEQNILLKENSAGTGTTTSIIHTAAGNGNPFLYEVTERYPRYPQEGDNVTIKAITQPYSETQSLNLVYFVNTSHENKVPMKAITNKAGEKIWEAQIGSFAACDSVSYKFELLENSNSIETTALESENYEFATGKWVKLSNINAIIKKSESIDIFYQKVSGINGVPCLKISANEGKINSRFCLEVDYPINSEESNNGIADINVDAMRTGEFHLGQYTVEINENGTELKLLDSHSNVIMESHSTVGFLELLIDGSGEVQKLKLNLQMAGEERLFGTGERYSHLELRGQSLENYVYNQYREQGLRTYMPIPFIMSSRGYGVYFGTAFYARFSFGTSLSDLMEFELDLDNTTQELDFYVFPGNPKEVLQAYSQIVGKPELPPKWSFGPWMSSNNWDSQQEAYKQVGLNKKYEIPSTVMVFEQWSDEATFYIFNDAQYDMKDGNAYLEYGDYRFPEWGRWPDPKQLVENLHTEGLKVILWQAPVMKYMDGIAHAQRDEDERVMLEKGYHVKHENGEAYRVPYHEWFKRSLIPDFTNPYAKEWWLNKRLYLVKDIGIDGFKTDGGECVYGNDLVFYDGTPSKAMRNEYPNAYIGSYYEFIKQHAKGQGITFSRAGYTGAHRIPLHWAGDERSTFDAFEHSLKAGLSSAISGITFWGWDLAGFNGDIPSAELYIRSTEMAAFCPVMQYHAETKGEYNQDRTPWNIAERTGNSDVIAIYKKYADLRMNILPYIYMQAMDSCETGIPVMRSMFMEYPKDSCCIDMYQQYMFGESLLVAPVIEEGSTTKSVYFPKGKWISLFDNKMFSGESLERVRVGIEEIPVYIRENSVIPLNLSDEFKLCSSVSNEVTAYKNLCFMVFVTASLQYHFKDDLGNEIMLDVCRAGEHIEIKTECNNKEVPMTVILREVDSSTKVEVNGLVAKTQVTDGDLLLRIDRIDSF